MLLMTAKTAKTAAATAKTAAATAKTAAAKTTKAATAKTAAKTTATAKKPSKAAIREATAEFSIIPDDPTAYERLVQSVYQSILEQEGARNIDVIHNRKILGQSGAKHQIDVHWSFESGGVVHTVVVECKKHNRPAEKNDVSAFITILGDLPDTPRGIFVSRAGFQAGAKKLARKHNIILAEIRDPDATQGDLGDEIRILGWTLTLSHREYDGMGANSFEFDRAAILAELKARRLDKIDIAVTMYDTQGPEVYDSDGIFLGRLVQLLDKVPAPEGELYKHTFEPSMYLATGSDTLPRVPVVAVTFRYVTHTSTSSHVIDFVPLVLNDVLRRTQIRFSRAYPGGALTPTERRPHPSIEGMVAPADDHEDV